MSNRRDGVLLLVLAIALMAAATAWAAPKDDKVPSAFVHGVLITLAEGDYALAGPGDGPGGIPDIPGHHWLVADKYEVVGVHYNTGPFGAPQWWSSDAKDGRLLYMVHGIIAPWDEETAEEMAGLGYVHYHELVKWDPGEADHLMLHPYLVLWLKHIAVTRFTLDGGPHPEFAHEVTPGIDYEFIPNGFVPYAP